MLNLGVGWGGVEGSEESAAMTDGASMVRGGRGRGVRGEEGMDL